jgi:hypothetical protein
MKLFEHLNPVKVKDEIEVTLCEKPYQCSTCSIFLLTGKEVRFSMFKENTIETNTFRSVEYSEPINQKNNRLLNIKGINKWIKQTLQREQQQVQSLPILLNNKLSFNQATNEIFIHLRIIYPLYNSDNHSPSNTPTTPHTQTLTITETDDQTISEQESMQELGIYPNEQYQPIDDIFDKLWSDENQHKKIEKLQAEFLYSFGLFLLNYSPNKKNNPIKWDISLSAIQELKENETRI